jgi:hypothetical protein
MLWSLLVGPAQEPVMHFDERDAGDFKIYTGAMEAADLGYLASLVIKRVRGIPTPREVYRDEDMACGHVWPSASEALRYAMSVAERLIRDRPTLQA